MKKKTEVSTLRTPVVTVAHPRGWLRELQPPPLKGEKIESFVVITRNLIPKSLKTYHFLNKTSKIDFLRLKNTIFQNFALAAIGILYLAPPLTNF